MVSHKTQIMLATVFTAMTVQMAFGQATQTVRREAAKPVIGNINSVDTQIATYLMFDNKGAVALAELGQQKAKDKDVREFAEKMAEDHNALLKQLQRFAGSRKEGVNSRISSTNATPGAVAQPVNDQSVDFVSLKQQINERCLDLVRRDLEKKEGSQFDKCYIGQQIGAHMHMLATLEVVRDQTSAELRDVLDKAIKSTKSHLEHAQEIAKSLE